MIADQYSTHLVGDGLLAFALLVLWFLLNFVLFILMGECPDTNFRLSRGLAGALRDRESTGASLFVFCDRPRPLSGIFACFSGTRGNMGGGVVTPSLTGITLVPVLEDFIDLYDLGGKGGKVFGSEYFMFKSTLSYGPVLLRL